MGLGVLSCPPQAAGTLVASHPHHSHSLEAGTAKDSEKEQWKDRLSQ